MTKKDKRVYIRCPWCSRQPVQVQRGRLVQHVTPGNLLCAGSGMAYPEVLEPKHVKPPR